MMYTLTIDDKPRSCRTSFKRDLNKKIIAFIRQQMLEKRDSFAENGKCICTLGAATFNLQSSSKIFGFKIDFRKIHVPADQFTLVSGGW